MNEENGPLETQTDCGKEGGETGQGSGNGPSGEGARRGGLGDLGFPPFCSQSQRGPHSDQ